MIAFAELGGSSYLGVYASASDRYAVIPKNTPPAVKERVSSVLGVSVIETTVAGTMLIGSLIAMNSNGAVVSNYVTEDEERLIRRNINTCQISDRYNAAGNNIVANDRGAIVNPDMSGKAIRKISDALGVEVVKGTIAGLKTVGSACAASNRGALCHPETTEEEQRLLEDVLKVKAMIGTANYGVPLVGACLLANSNGCLTGAPTTPIELGRMEDALGV